MNDSLQTFRNIQLYVLKVTEMEIWQLYGQYFL